MKVTVASVVALLVAALLGYLYGRKSAEKEGYANESTTFVYVIAGILGTVVVGGLIFGIIKMLTHGRR